MKKKKIAIIGHFGANKSFLDGQTIKTKILYDELCSSTDWKIYKVDTYYKKHNPVKLILSTLYCLITTKDIIVLLSGNGMRVYFPLLSFFANRFKTRIYHDVIGGNLDGYIRSNRRFKEYLNSFVVNWVETSNLKKRVEETGVVNCEVLPNFKRLNIVESVDKDYSNPFKFCIFSRVMKEKGVEQAINAIQALNKRYGCCVCRLDIYGDIDIGYRNEFDSIMQNVTDAIEYKGIVPYDKSVEVLKGYYALLFPTFWHGEGFPGTIVDAYSAGLPVIATDWNCNSEIVSNGINGIVYPNSQISSLEEAIDWAINHCDKVYDMKQACIFTAKMYSPDIHIKKIITEIESKGRQK